jgi:hypothetical protein
MRFFARSFREGRAKNSPSPQSFTPVRTASVSSAARIHPLAGCDDFRFGQMNKAELSCIGSESAAPAIDTRRLIKHHSGS